MFSKSHLTEQIKAGGGKLYDRFEDVPPSKYDSCYLISDRPNQTAKFILCLAHGIQLVSYAWIIECCEVSGYLCLKIKTMWYKLDMWIRRFVSTV